MTDEAEKPIYSVTMEAFNEAIDEIERGRERLRVLTEAARAVDDAFSGAHYEDVRGAIQALRAVLDDHPRVEAEFDSENRVVWRAVPSEETPQP